MVCPLGGTVSHPQPPNYDRVELEGVGMLVLPNSLDAPLERLELGGKTEQISMTGKNLLDVDAIINRKGINGSGEVISRTGSCVTDFIFLKPETYTFSLDNKSKDTQIAIYLYNDDKTFNKYLLSNLNETSKIIVDKNMYMIVMFNKEKSIVSNKHVMLEIGSNKTPYEPYTGGKPSPSPEYPQEIKNAGKWNEETQKYEVDVKITGKNLLNLQKEPDVKGTYQGWKVGNGELLTLGVKDKGNNADIKGCYIGFSDQGSESKGVVWVVDNGVIKMNPLTQRKSYVSIFPANETTVKKLTERLDIQCELGNVATPYQPYKEQTLTITSDRPITKWDRLVEQGGEIGWLYKSKVYDGFDGKNNRIELGNKVGNVQHFSVYFASTPNSAGNANSYCDKYIGVNVSWTKEKFGIFCDWNNGVKFFSAPNEKVTNSEEFKAWLIENPLKIAYETTNPEFIPLPQSEQNAIRALKTYYPTTVITVDGGELDPDIKVTYRKEI